jgi:monovalent cation/hydrogen antiporter
LHLLSEPYNDIVAHVRVLYNVRVNATNWRNTQEEIYLEETVLIIFSLLAAMVLLVALANRLSIPYPILLVLAGFIISLIPGLPSIELNPSLVFILFLPPILQSSAYYTPMRDFRANLRSISLLAIGLVLATMVGVAIVAHALIPGLPWAAAFVLGAIVAPPDAVAASSIAQRLKLPRRIVTVLEGESMLNDATSLVSYRVAVAAVVTGVFSFWQAGAQFLLSSIGGVAIGIAVGLILTPLFRRLTQDIPVYLILTFLSGYGAYLLADRLQCSGVLAVVALGMFYIRVNTMTPELRIQGTAIWDIVVFLLNGLIFILIGLQMRSVIEQLSGRSLITLVWYAFIICLTAILIRIAWVFPGTYLPRLPARVRARSLSALAACRYRRLDGYAWCRLAGLGALTAPGAGKRTTIPATRPDYLPDILGYPGDAGLSGPDPAALDSLAEDRGRWWQRAGGE